MSFDIDIDFLDRSAALEVLPHIVASRAVDSKLVPHSTGIYLQSIPHDPITNMASIDYKSASDRGYFKIDFLNVGVYAGVRDEAHLQHLMDTEPMWDLLEQEEFSSLLFHIGNYGSILREMKPVNVEQLAAILAIIRPAKRHLIGKDWNTILQEVWDKPADDTYYFKKSHATSYAMAIVVQMNLICQQVSYEYA